MCKTSPQTPHQCTKNHVGSSKSMEAKAAVDMFCRAQDKGLQYTTLIGDDDSTTLHHVRKSVNYEVKKWSDIQHTKHSLYGQLIQLKKKHNQFTDMAVAYFRRLFAYALTNNINDPENLAKTLKTITPHAYGDHIDCGDWCKFNENPDSYKHKGLPRGKPLTDHDTKRSMNTLCEFLLFSELIIDCDK